MEFVSSLLTSGVIVIFMAGAIVSGIFVGKKLRDKKDKTME